MRPLDRNIAVLEHIVFYCRQINDIPTLKKYCETIIASQQ